MHKVFDWFQTFDKKLTSFSISEAKKLKLRLRIFLCVYIPCVVTILIAVISSNAFAGNKGTEKRNEEETGAGGSLRAWIEQSTSDGIYSYNAGEDAQYQLYTPAWSSDEDITYSWETIGTENMQPFWDWAGDILYNAWTGTVEESGDDSNPMGSIIGNIISFILAQKFAIWKLLIILFRILITQPFFFLESMMSALGPNWWPTSLYGLFLGRVGSNGMVTTNLFGFELVNNNIYGIVSSITYGLISSVVMIGIVIELTAKIIMVAVDGGESRGRLKESVVGCAGKLILMPLLPFLTYLACYIRDHLLYEILLVTQNLSSLNLSGREGISNDGLVMTDLAQFNIACSRALNIGMGSSYNPFVERAFDFQNGTIFDSLIYDGSVILLIVFIFIYISLALDTTFTFGFGAPIALLRGKAAIMEWAQHMIANILTPVVDMLVLMVPLILGSMHLADQTTYVGVSLVELVICFCYFPLRNSIRAKLNTQSSQAAESMGMGSMMMSLAALRTAASGVMSIASNAKDGLSEMKGIDESVERGDEAITAAQQNISDMKKNINDLDNRMKMVPGAEKAGDAENDSLREIGEGGIADRMDSAYDSDTPGYADEYSNNSENELSAIHDFASGRTDGMEDDGSELAEIDGIQTGEASVSGIPATEEETGKNDEISGYLSQAERTENGLSDKVRSQAVSDERRMRGSAINNQRQNKPIAGSYADMAVQLSKRGKYYADSREKLQNAANETRMKQNQLRTIMEKAKYGMPLSAAEQQIYGSKEDAAVTLQQLGEREYELRTQAQTAAEGYRQAVQYSNDMRRMMGMSGGGLINTAELNSYMAVQQSANAMNYQNPDIQKYLSPDLQRKFALQRRKEIKNGLTAGLTVTSALAPIVAGASYFLPIAGKGALMGATASLGGAVMANAPRIRLQGQIKGMDGATAMRYTSADLQPNSVPPDISKVRLNVNVAEPAPVSTGTMHTGTENIDLQNIAMQAINKLSADYGIASRQAPVTNVDNLKTCLNCIARVNLEGTQGNPVVTKQELASWGNNDELMIQLCLYGDYTRQARAALQSQVSQADESAVREAVERSVREYMYAHYESVMPSGSTYDSNALSEHHNMVVDVYNRLQQVYSQNSDIRMQTSEISHIIATQMNRFFETEENS